MPEIVLKLRPYRMHVYEASFVIPNTVRGPLVHAPKSFSKSLAVFASHDVTLNNLQVPKWPLLSG